MNILKTTIRQGLILILCILTNVTHAQVSEKGDNIQIDGELNEQIWNNARKISNLVQIEPEIFAPSVVKSEFYFTYDTQNIYLGGKIYQEKSSISAGNARKDDEKINHGDYVTIGIDPLNNGNSAFFFRINPVNAQADGTIDMDGNFDFSWDAIFVSETKITDHYWTFEIKIPLTSLTFQNKKVQSWGVMFSRYCAHEQELSINQIQDKNAPFNIRHFYKIDGVKGLRKSKKIVVTPYMYGHSVYSALNDSISYGAKMGGEIKYNPTPSTTIYATFNPDYAQIETDKELINISDIPTTYPEKRPFFTESSDMYPGLAVNTRNITDINAGLKVRNVGTNSKIDFTAVYDKQKNIWGMSDIRLTDNMKYHFEVISGIKSSNTDYLKDYNYNVTVHGKLYFFDKKIQVYTWYGTVNRPKGNANEYESVNAVKWISRSWNAGLWNHFISELYIPGVVGSPTLSNQYILDGWLGYSFYNGQSFFRKTTITSHLLRNGLFTDRDKAYYENTNEIDNQLYLGNTLGNWNINIIYKPSLKAKFRYRNQANFNQQQEFTDGIGRFVLIDQSANTYSLDLKTDASKITGGEFIYDNSLVRKSKANNYSFNLFLKIGSKIMVDYSYNFVDIKGSEYQNAFKQSIHRIKAEYNFTKKMNLRFVFQPVSVKQQPDDLYNRNAINNLTFSWEFIPGGNFYLVYNNFKNYNQTAYSSNQLMDNNHSLILKISKTF